MIYNILTIIICFIVLGSIIIRSINKVTNEQFKYYLNIIKKDTNIYSDKISFKEELLKSKLGSPTIRLNVEGKMCNFLLDTGANVNIINKSVFDKINKGKNLEVISSDDNITFGNGTSKLDGQVILNFSHKRFKFKDTFEVLDLSESFGSLASQGLELDGILGSSFFKDNQWSVDFNEMVIWVK